MGILGALRLSSNEVVMTRALGVLLNESREFSSRFLATFFSAKNPTQVSAQWEVSVGDHGRIDLLITWHDEDRVHCAVVEHKLKAGEGEDQTVRYRSVAASLWASISIGQTQRASALPHLLFLALLPWEHPRDEGFIRGTHQQLIPALRAATSHDQAFIAAIASEWAEELEQFYATNVDAGATSVLDRLRAETPGGLPKGCLLVPKLAEFMSVRLSGAGLNINNIYRSSALGHSWIGLIIEKRDKQWCRALTGGDATSGPQAFLHYQVHLPLSGGDDVAARIALEMLPYRPQKEARRLYSDLFVDAYKTQRSVFIAAVRDDLLKRGWSVQDRWNYLASQRVTDCNHSVQALAEKLSELFVSVQPRLDEAWRAVSFGGG